MPAAKSLGRGQDVMCGTCSDVRNHVIRRPRALPTWRHQVLALGCAATLAVALGSSTFAFLSALSKPANSRSTVARNYWTYHNPEAKQTTFPLAKPPPDLMTLKQRQFVPSAEKLEYAVVEYSGRQHMVQEGMMYETYFIRAVPGAKVRLNRVLLLKQWNEELGEYTVTIGQPFCEGAYIDITILEHLKSEDIEIMKHKKKKHYMRRFIDQMKLTRFRIDKIVGNYDLTLPIPANIKEAADKHGLDSEAVYDLAMIPKEKSDELISELDKETIRDPTRFVSCRSEPEIKKIKWEMRKVREYERWQLQQEMLDKESQQEKERKGKPTWRDMHR